MLESLSTRGALELPHLATFAAVAEEGSFTAAAGKLGISQAAVSQRIAALEKELRISLFDRRSGRNSLTQPGRTLYDYARRILDLHQEARSSLEGSAAMVAGDLSIAASSVP